MGVEWCGAAKVSALPAVLSCALQARQILDEVAKQVQPILRRRHFTVPLLSEFYPDNGRLWVSKPCRRCVAGQLPQSIKAGLWFNQMCLANIACLPCI